MPHLSKRVLEPEIKKDILESFTRVVKEIDSFNDAEGFLSAVLTDTERMMIAKRITAAFLLRHNIGSERIQEMLKLTQGTVFRLNLWIQTHREGFDVLFDKLGKERRFRIAKTIFYKLLSYAIKAASGKVPNPFKESFYKGQLR